MLRIVSDVKRETNQPVPDVPKVPVVRALVPTQDWRDGQKHWAEPLLDCRTEDCSECYI